MFARCVVLMLAVIPPLTSGLLTSSFDSWPNRRLARGAMRAPALLDAIPGDAVKLTAADAWQRAALTHKAVRRALTSP